MTLSHAELGEIIDNAILNEEVICFWYEKRPQRGRVLRTLSPYECSPVGDTVLGYDHGREALRRFELSKIVAVEPYDDEEYVKPTPKEDR